MNNKSSHITQFIDLTHTIHEDIPTWDEEVGFEISLTSDYDTTLFRVQKFCCVAGLGTHIDAPAHIIKNGRTVADIPLTALIAQAHIIYINNAQEIDYAICVTDIKTYEELYGSITHNSLVILYTGWGEKWSEPKAYRNPDINNILHFPRLSSEAALYLLEKNIAGIAVDTLSADGSDIDFPVHKLLLSNNKVIIENLVYKPNLPPIGATLICLPLKIQGATESPARAVLSW